MPFLKLYNLKANVIILLQSQRPIELQSINNKMNQQVYKYFLIDIEFSSG